MNEKKDNRLIMLSFLFYFLDVWFFLTFRSSSNKRLKFSTLASNSLIWASFSDSGSDLNSSKSLFCCSSNSSGSESTGVGDWSSSPKSNQVGEHFKASLKAKRLFPFGSVWPLSHLNTLTLDFFTISASCCCVSPSSLRLADMRSLRCVSFIAII